ncbi:tetratricopeptide-like helical domain-containing protein [Heterostelium album PN500]|uniref:Tetratricopeptide-like helical domain-containing protein n=1 Tax=Heterostelium pallidum (strain ATCC 26659 / Pp 5 / PN500) TaxID=670386 RepID=D3BNR6_HETP5|nr:tetratricopeptide-like helical domain-containing protein [Heterostelium album PN500]EFA76835.1 tetratricopeptide-like helical domain-containing protein [Heterostelium album PN500]|eukprot:XP_020428967.1 tetratricopeptide-like helical domain-containing protein [Heterostelium album PN500]
MLKSTCKSISNSVVKSYSSSLFRYTFCQYNNDRFYSSGNKKSESIFTRLPDDHQMKVKKQQQLLKQQEEIEQQHRILESGNAPKDIFEEKHLDFFKNVLKKRKPVKPSAFDNHDEENHLYQQKHNSNNQRHQQRQHQSNLDYNMDDDFDEEHESNQAEDDQIYNKLNLDRPENPEELLRSILSRVVVSEEFIDLPEERDDINAIRDVLLSKDVIQQVNKDNEKKFSEARALYVSGFHKRAFDMFTNEVDQRHGMANVFLGNMYFNGVGVEQDMSAAYRHFVVASVARIPVAFGMLGEMNLKGMGVSMVNERLARTYFDIAASMNLKSSMEQVVYMIINGVGGEFNLKKASFYLKLLAEKGDVQAVVTLGGLLYEHEKKVALALWNYAAQMGSADAMYYLGRHYYSRDNPDYNHAFVLWMRAAELGNVNSQFCLGGMYDIGLICERNTQTAMELYEVAANAGHVDAQFLLGKYYYYGVGIEADRETGIKYLQMAAKQGDLSAIELIQEISKKVEE